MVLASGGVIVLGAGVAAAAGVADDALRAVGARPARIPDASDIELVRTAAREQASLVATARGIEDADGLEDVRALLERQLEVLADEPTSERSAGAPAAPDTEDGASVDTLADLVEQTADLRAGDVLVAVAPDLARVLASLSAGLTQIASTLRERS